MPDLPADWQHRMVEMIRGAEPLRDEWFAGGPVCSPMQQIAIYENQYRLRLYEALDTEIPGLSHLLGEAGEPLLRRYLMENPSGSWTLNRVADRLPEWLSRQADAEPAHVEMAHLDRAVQKGFEAAEPVPIDPADLLLLPRLRLAPPVSLLRLAHNVHEVRSAALTGSDPPPVRTGDWPLVVFRRGIKMRHWVLPLGAWGVLDGVRAGLSVPEALDDAFGRGLTTPAELESEIGGWFRDFAERNLVEIAG